MPTLMFMLILWEGEESIDSTFFSSAFYLEEEEKSVLILWEGEEKVADEEMFLRVGTTRI